MQTKLSKSVALIGAGILASLQASAHPGHAPTDTVAQVTAPLAGPDHLLVFVALSTVVLVTVGVGLKFRAAKNAAARK